MSMNQYKIPQNISRHFLKQDVYTPYGIVIMALGTDNIHPPLRHYTDIVS